MLYKQSFSEFIEESLGLDINEGLILNCRLEKFISEKTRYSKEFSKGNFNTKEFDFKNLKSGEEVTKDDLLSLFGYKDTSQVLSNITNKMYGGLNVSYGNNYLQSQVRGYKNFEMYYKDRVEPWLNGDKYINAPFFIEDSEDSLNYWNKTGNTVKLKIKTKSIFNVIKNYITNSIEEIERLTGIDEKTLLDGFKWIIRFRESAKRTIDKSLYPFLQMLTIKNKTQLPKKIYRGIFLDGDKFNKMTTKEQDKYVVGGYVKLNNLKATSWSSSKDLAIDFMSPQDNIKNINDGYKILLSYTIEDINDIVADFRVFPSMKFFNQQELLLSPKVKVGKIEMIEKNGVEVKTMNRFGDNSFSYTITDYIKNIINVSRFNLSKNELIEIKKYIKKPLGETILDFPEISRKLNMKYEELVLKKDLLTPLAVTIKLPERVISSTEVVIKNTQTILDGYPNVLTYKDSISKNKIINSINGYEIRGTVKLLKNNPYNFVFKFVVDELNIFMKVSSKISEGEARDIIISSLKNSEKEKLLYLFVEDPHNLMQKGVNTIIDINI